MIDNIPLTIREIEGSEYTEIQTPFLRHNNDCIAYYFKKLDNGNVEIVDDDTYSELFLYGHDITPGGDIDLWVKMQANKGGCIVVNDDIIATCEDDPEEIKWAVSELLRVTMYVEAFIGGALHKAYMELTPRQREFIAKESAGWMKDVGVPQKDIDEYVASVKKE